MSWLQNKISRSILYELKMDERLIESYLDNIAELVVDEDKIVTFKSLGRSLGIHVNIAKQLLHTYLTQQKTQNAFPISATYLLAGKLADGSFNVTIASENELESTYSKFVEITSEHVYSVQKGKNVREVNMLCGVDKGAQESTSLVITSSKCVLKSKDDVKKKLDFNKEDNKEAIKKVFGIEKEKVCTEESNEKIKSPVKKEIMMSPKKRKEKTGANVKKPVGNIANMFAKAAQKNAEKPKNVTNEEKKPGVLISSEEAGVQQCKAGKSTSNAFAEDEEISLRATEKVSKTKEVSEVSLSSDDNDDDDEVEVVREKRRNKRVPQASAKKGKRKRIRMGSTSNESDSNEEPQQTAAEKEDSNSPITVLNDDEEPVARQPLNKRKKRKIVDKTFVHDDGYLETRKEVIYETDSDDAEEQPKKEEKNKPSAKPKPETSNAAKKQSSLLMFFKKG